MDVSVQSILNDKDDGFVYIAMELSVLWKKIMIESNILQRIKGIFFPAGLVWN